MKTKKSLFKDSSPRELLRTASAQLRALREARIYRDKVSPRCLSNRKLAELAEFLWDLSESEKGAAK